MVGLVEVAVDVCEAAVLVESTCDALGDAALAHTGLADDEDDRGIRLRLAPGQEVGDDPFTEDLLVLCLRQLIPLDLGRVDGARDGRTGRRRRCDAQPVLARV